MAADGQIRVTLELDIREDPVRGLVREESGVEHRFFGWVGLAGVLETLGTAAPRDQVELERT